MRFSLPGTSMTSRSAVRFYSKMFRVRRCQTTAWVRHFAIEDPPLNWCSSKVRQRFDQSSRRRKPTPRRCTEGAGATHLQQGWRQPVLRTPLLLEKTETWLRSSRAATVGSGMSRTRRCRPGVCAV